MINSNRLFLKEAHAATLTFWKSFRLPWCKAWIDSSPAGRHLAGKLMDEEFKELLAASTPEQKLDAYCDLLYVTAGAMHALGYDHNYLNGIDETPNFTGPLAEAIRLIQEPGIVCHRRLQNAIPSAMLGITETAEHFFPKFRNAFRAVHSANMSKLWKTPSKDPMHINENIGPNLWLVKHRDTGKVMKSPEFKHPNLAKYI